MVYGEPLSNTVSWANFVPRRNYEPQRVSFPRTFLWVRFELNFNVFLHCSLLIESENKEKQNDNVETREQERERERRHLKYFSSLFVKNRMRKTPRNISDLFCRTVFYRNFNNENIVTRKAKPNKWQEEKRFSFPTFQFVAFFQRRFLILIQIIAALCLILTVAALIVVFAVESSWFYDNFQGASVRYGLWRLCLSNGGCYSWFHNDGTIGNQIEQRLNQSRSSKNFELRSNAILTFLCSNFQLESTRGKL